MEAIHELKKHQHHSKIAIFGIVGFLVIITFLVILISNRIQSEQVYQTRSMASEIYLPFPTPTNPAPTQCSAPTWSQPMPAGQCEELKRKYSCVRTIGGGDYVSCTHCARNFNPSCEDSSKITIPPEYEKYCRKYEGLVFPPWITPEPGMSPPPDWRKIDGVTCVFPDDKCISADGGFCNEERLQLAATFCGCYKPSQACTQYGGSCDPNGDSCCENLSCITEAGGNYCL